MQIIKHSKFYILLSLLVLIPGVVSLFTAGLKMSIDFTGGSVFDYQFAQPIEDRSVVESAVKDSFGTNNIDVETVSFVDDDKVSIRTKPVEANTSDTILKDLQFKFAGLTQQGFETVGPSIGQETARNSIVAVAVATVGILLYIAFAFRNIPKPYSSFTFGACAIIAMLHDVFVVLGIFSLLRIEIDALFITAMLTIIGFSVHDTIVVFDRIRENLRKLPAGWSFANVVNYSLIETLNRSLATSLTVIITLTALLVLGGASTRNFVLALLVGIISGTYSSIFNASPILVYWEEWIAKRNKK